MTAIQFEEAIKPAKITRVENPFLAIVTELRDGENKDRAISFTIDAPKGCEKDSEDAAVLKARRQLTDAGNTAGVTVRTTYKLVAKGKVQITFWTVEKIRRNPKDATADAVAPAKAAAKPAAAKKAAPARRK